MKKSIMFNYMLASVGSASVTSDRNSIQAGLSYFLKMDFIIL